MKYNLSYDSLTIGSRLLTYSSCCYSNFSGIPSLEKSRDLELKLRRQSETLFLVYLLEKSLNECLKFALPQFNTIQGYENMFEVSKIKKNIIPPLTRFWLGFFMDIKWLGGE